MKADEYKRFLNFLRTFNCHLPFSTFRAAPPRTASDAKTPPSDVELRDAV
jgi:hypothetical protein